MIRVRRSTQNLTATVDILVQAGDANTARRFAPIAAVLDDVDELELRHDADHRHVFCDGDMFGAEGGSDVKYFKEPAWSSIGGNALVYGYQYDGREWRQNFTFVVEDVDTTAHSITYVDLSFTGTFKERQYTILTLAPYNDQADALWTRSLFVVNTGANAKFGATKGFELLT